jgi:hypothetical protein
MPFLRLSCAFLPLFLEIKLNTYTSIIVKSVLTYKLSNLLFVPCLSPVSHVPLNINFKVLVSILARVKVSIQPAGAFTSAKVGEVMTFRAKTKNIEIISRGYRSSINQNNRVLYVANKALPLPAKFPDCFHHRLSSRYA